MNDTIDLKTSSPCPPLTALQKQPPPRRIHRLHRRAAEDEPGVQESRHERADDHNRHTHGDPHHPVPHRVHVNTTSTLEGVTSVGARPHETKNRPEKSKKNFTLSTPNRLLSTIR